MRKKENAQEYRYFPEPDLPVFIPDPEFLTMVENSLVELPVKRMNRIKEEYGLSPEQADLICEEKEGADYFEAAVAAAVKLDPGLAPRELAARIANFLLAEIKHILNREGLSPSDLGSFTLGPDRLASLAVMTCRGKVSGKNARQAMELSLSENKDPEIIIREKGWDLLSDPDAIAEAVRAVHTAEAAVFSEASAVTGNPKRRKTLTAFLVGKVLAATNGRADPEIAGKQIEEIIARS